MPFTVIPEVLGTAFLLVWLFIGGMILRDGQREARRQRQLRVDSAHTKPAQRQGRLPNRREAVIY